MSAQPPSPLKRAHRCQGADPHFKTSVWDLSQNVDRSDPRRTKLGICPCLTPSLYAYSCAAVCASCLVPLARFLAIAAGNPLASVRNLCAAMKVRIRDESWRPDRRNRDTRKLQVA